MSEIGIVRGRPKAKDTTEVGLRHGPPGGDADAIVRGRPTAKEAREARLLGAAAAETDCVVFRPADLFALSVPLLFGLAIASSGSRVHDWERVSAALFAAAVFAIACRTWASRSTRTIAQIFGNFYVIATVWVTYSRLNPLIDVVSPVPYDRDLQAIDQTLFGVQPSVWLEAIHHPVLTEILFISYALFFFWQLALGVLLFLRGDRRALGDYLLTVIMFYMLSYVSYVLVPAIGPRFDLAHAYSVPLEGLFFAKEIETAFMNVPMLRDCFPSGHTGLTLLVLFHAYRKGERVFFAVMLPFAMLLIFSTVYCRFHYVVDLLCALPFVAGVLLLQRWLIEALPHGIRVPFPVRTLRGLRAEER